MVLRFTEDAREAVRSAQEEARRLGHRCIGVDHLLLGLAEQNTEHTENEDTADAAEALAARGLQPDAVRRVLVRRAGGALDADALAAVGVDLTRVQEAAEAQFGPGVLDGPAGPLRTGHLPVSGRLEAAFGRAADAARRRGQSRMTGVHLLLGVLEDDGGPAVAVVRELGVDPAGLAAELRGRLDRTPA